MSENVRFLNLPLWSNAFVNYKAEYPDECNRLQTALIQMRKCVRPLGKLISESLPGYTVHDLTHSEALWGMADLIVGNDCTQGSNSTSTLTPTEAFCLGAAFLIHDLGMGLASYPGGLQQIQQHPRWQDVIAREIRLQTGRSATQQEKDHPSVEIQGRAVNQLLRQLHAEQAESLAKGFWESKGIRVYLIEDAELREKFGGLIGQIAHSHWWSVNELTQKLPTTPKTPPGDFPNSWTVDAIKLACIIRLADFAHIDDRRAPFYERVFRQLHGESDTHWTFQDNVGVPYAKDNRLIYTSHNPFTRDQISSWWLCYETLRDLDQQLREVDALLADTHRQRFIMRGVASVEAPERLANQVETRDWHPIDAQVKVGNVAALVRHLGGEQLYGDDPKVPLRELIQNACDAVRARRILEDSNIDWGDVVVLIGRDNNGTWIEVQDNGVGMSQTVLTGPFLDFGNSFWGSGLMHSELPGLDSKGFESTGRFGIGFFSVFMWGDRVQVTTRRYEKGQEDTIVLEFGGNLSNRPLIRKAETGERLSQGGTRIRVWFKRQEDLQRILEEDHPFPPEIDGLPHINYLVQFCTWLCPALDVNLWAECEGRKVLAIAANDWTKIDPSELNGRIMNYGRLRQLYPFDLLINDDNKVIGRLSCDPRDNQYGVIVTGGFLSQRIDSLKGIIFGEASSAVRNSANVPQNETAFNNWGSQQRRFWQQQQPSWEAIKVANILSNLNIDIQGLPIGFYRGAFLTGQDISARNWELPLYVIEYNDVTLELFGEVTNVDVIFTLTGKRMMRSGGNLLDSRSRSRFDHNSLYTIFERYNGVTLEHLILQGVTANSTVGATGEINMWDCKLSECSLSTYVDLPESGYLRGTEVDGITVFEIIVDD